MKNRRSDAADVRLDIEQAQKESGVAATPVPARNSRLAWIAAAVMTLAFVAIAVVHFQGKAAEAPEMRLEITTPATDRLTDFALSPDGRSIVFVARGDGAERLWLRNLDNTAARALDGTEDAKSPFWSPDGRSIGFWAAGKLKRVDVKGGLPQTLADASKFFGGTWNADGTILFSSGGPLFRIAASGGKAAAVTLPDFAPSGRPLDNQYAHFLPDGRHFLFNVIGGLDVSGVYLGSLDGGEPKRIMGGAINAQYLKPDRIVFLQQGALMAQQIDLKRGELAGDPVKLADRVMDGFSISADGGIAYRSGEGNNSSRRQFAWVDRAGKPAGNLGDIDSSNPLVPELSPDGRRVAIDRVVQGNRDVWLMDIKSGGLTRFTFDPAVDGYPVWSPDGTRIAFESTRKGPLNLYAKPANGAGIEERLQESLHNQWPLDWSPDGRFLLYGDDVDMTKGDLWALPMSGANASPAGRSDSEMTGNQRKPIAIATTPFIELGGKFSPDGRWVAYDTNESGRFEVVVQSFPNPTGKWQVSTGGGMNPRWRSDGKELYFISPDGKLMAAAVQASASAFETATPVALFSAANAFLNQGYYKPQCAVSADGRFLIGQPVVDSTTPITLILNWHPERGK